MSRYINAEDIKLFLEVSKLVGVELNVDNMLKILETTPTADVVEVVRCKDCKHYENNDDILGYCKLHTGNAGYCEEAVYMEEDDYCSYGKKVE